MRIVVNVPMAHCPEENSYDIDVENTATLLTLKQQIQDATGIPVDEQWIMAPWETYVPMSTTLAELNVHEGATMCVRQYIVFFVHCTCLATSITLLADTCDTVYQVKIWVERQTGIPILDQQLCFNGQVLHDELTLEHAKIKELSAVTLLWMPDPGHASKAGVTAVWSPCEDDD